MSKPYKFQPLNRSLYWVASEPTKRFFTVHFKFVLSFNPVLTEPLYVAQSYRDAFDYLEAMASFVPNTKKRQLLVKQPGIKHRHYFYDEQFAEALEVEDVNADEWYKEPTTDERSFVRLDHKKHIVTAKWKGIRREEGKRDVSVLDTWEGGLG